MSLHNEIMNIKCDTEGMTGINLILAYKRGHRDARHAAAELALKADSEIESLKSALEKIANWELPDTGQFWDKEKTDPVSYEAVYGSHGARDFIKEIASEALK